MEGDGWNRRKIKHAERWKHKIAACELLSHYFNTVERMIAHEVYANIVMDLNYNEILFMWKWIQKVNVYTLSVYNF